jgi:lysophospholipase L1-like esterase
MAFSDLFSRLRPSESRNRGTNGQAGTRERKLHCQVEHLEDRTTPSSLKFLTLGDSLTAPYSGQRASQGDKSWIQLLSQADGNNVQIVNFAQPGATSVGVVNGQAISASEAVKSQGIDYVVLEIGGNDAAHYASQLALGSSQTFITQVTTNIEKSLLMIQKANPKVHEVLGLIPDISVSPMVQGKAGGNPFLIGNIHNAIMAANQQLKTWAAAHGVAVVDINAMFAQTGHPFNMDGTMITKDFFSPDGFHPGNVEQALWGNAVLTAFSRFGASTSNLMLSDQYICQISGNGGPSATSHTATYYNVGQFVIGPNSAAPTAAPATSVQATPSSTMPQSWYLGGLRPLPWQSLAPSSQVDAAGLDFVFAV